MHSILVKDYMDENPHSINQNASIREAIELLMREKVTGAPVVDDDKMLVGFVSEQDCLKQILNDAFYAEGDHQVNQVMSSQVATVTPDASIVEIAESMSKRPPKNYPVCVGSKLVGLISRRMILKALVEHNRDVFGRA